jgi:hypothetical protein
VSGGRSRNGALVGCGIAHAASMSELIVALFHLLRASLRARGDPVLENALLRHQLAILTRPTRQQRTPNPSSHDSLTGR